MTKFWGILAALMFGLALFASAAYSNGYNDYPSKLQWSPTGDFVAAAVDGELWIVFPAGHADMVAQGEISSPSVSPDGMLVAYVNGGSLMVYSFIDQDIYILDDSGEILDCAFETMPGERYEFFLYYSKGERFYGCDIFSIRVEERQAGLTFYGEENITRTPDVSECSPALSPFDGSIYFLSQGGDTPGGYEQLWRLQGTSAKPATGSSDFGEWGYHESNPAFFEERTIFFERGGWGLWDLFALDPLSGKESIVFAGAGKPSVSQYRGILAFTRPDYYSVDHEMETWEYPLSVWVADLETGNEFQVSPSGIHSDFPAVNTDGTHVAWIEYFGGRSRVVIRTTIDAVG